jgi:hypothetical protein
MRRTLAALAISALGLLAVPAPVAARTNAHPFAPANPGLLTAAPSPESAKDETGTGISVILDPARSSTQTIVVTNGTTDRRLTLGIEPVDASRRSDGIHYATEATKNGAQSWLDVSTGVVVVEPNATASIDLTISASADAASGDTSLAGIKVYAQSADLVAGGDGGIDDIPVLTVPVARTVAGDPKPQLAITEVRATSKDGATSLSITLYNSGSVATTATGSVRTPGNQVKRDLSVDVPPRKDVTKLVEWTEINSARGADVVVDLEYGDGDNASWTGNVGPPPNTTPVTAAGIPDPDFGTADTPTTGGGGGGGGISLGTLLLVLLIVAVVVGAAIFFVSEIMRGRAPRAVPVNTAAMPPLQVVMDDRHTEVLDALATQVGALGGAIGELAEKLGVTVAIPSPPRPLKTPHHPKSEPARPRHATPAPASVAPPISERIAVTRARVTPAAMPPHEHLPTPGPKAVQEAIVDAMEGLNKPPVFTPPRPSEEWLFDDIAAPPPKLIVPPPPSDDPIDVFLAQRSPAPPPVLPTVTPKEQAEIEDEFWSRDHQGDDLDGF